MWGVPVPFNHYLHISQMTFDSLFAGSNDCFVTKRFASWVLSGVRFAYRELSDGPSQKIEAHMTLVVPEGMGNFRLTGFEFQSHRAQPCFQKGFGFLHTCLGRMKNDQIISVSDELRNALLVRECSSYRRFDAVQGYVHE